MAAKKPAGKPKAGTLTIFVISLQRRISIQLPLAIGAVFAALVSNGSGPQTMVAGHISAPGDVPGQYQMGCQL